MRTALACLLLLTACDDTRFGKPTAGGSSPSDTTPTDDTGGASRVHADGYAAPEVHGPDAKLQVLPCVSCHGDDLTGDGEAPSCDSCHEAGWRTLCTFCHGGTETDGGAPPRDIDGETDPSLGSFPHHTVHLSDTEYKLAFPCETCHAVPTDVLSAGHLFVGDGTPGQAELDFSGGLSPAGTWDGLTCSSLYCHGDGQGDNGSRTIGEEIEDCAACHPHRSSGSKAWAEMSGAHDRHLSMGEGFECGDCHKDVVITWAPIEDPSLHVNGRPDVRTVGTIVWDGDTETCTGECHLEEHDARSWFLEEARQARP